MRPQPARRVGLSVRNAPQPLLNDDDEEEEEDITAPPLASSDLENNDDDDNDDENAEHTETQAELDDLLGDSSDSDGPVSRGAIKPTIFKLQGREGGRRDRQSAGQDTNTEPESEEEAQAGSRKRKRNHLTDDLGFTKQAKPNVLPPHPLPGPGQSVRKSSQFIVDGSPEPSPIRPLRRLLHYPPKSRFDTADDDDTPALSFNNPKDLPDEADDFATNFNSKLKKKANPLLPRKKPIGGRKKKKADDDDEEEAAAAEEELNSSSSSSLSSLGSVFSRDSEKDTSAPCPWCGAAVDSKQLADFSKGKRLNVERQQRFCTSHKQKSAMATWESKAYPQVEWGPELEARFAKHRDHLLAIINGGASHYRAALADKIELGQERTAKKQGNMIPGYYGPRGFNAMTDYLVREFSDMLMKKAARDKVIAGRGVPMFIESVLVAELGVRLIMEDMRVSPEKARRILEETKDLGGLVHPEVR
ncbi:uncharacterized protein TRIREDRAFT_22589 [Trichoderma reesei QM6a]|uniref:Restriction of telomere capping protein 4 n=2 Tax=Hypocrea jecorina TaxID=51453 RepID=G0RMF9_HYPJQ|nr:uncharacterized protein TRIREDRAFT_22589 [Trichoderma reesei QM6a]EGR47647.1 predicted protein [Trichoderma reesei QM6a]